MNPLHRLFVALALTVVIFATPALVAQSDASTSLRTVHLFRSYPHAPIAIVKILNGTVEIKPDTPFEAGDDWLKGVSIVIKNVSPSEIVYVSVAAHLPETGDGTQQSPRVGGGNAVGQKPEAAMYSVLTGEPRAQGPSQPLNLAPGKEVVVPLIAARDYPTVKSLIEAKQTRSGVKKCDAYVTTVFFADGTKWAPANYWRPTEEKPGKYVSVAFQDWLGLEHIQ